MQLRYPYFTYFITIQILTLNQYEQINKITKNELFKITTYYYFIENITFKQKLK